MSRKAKKLLESIKASPHNHKRQDLERLYVGYGFKIETDGPHDKISHPDFSQLITFLPRHNDLPAVYFRDAVKIIEKLEQLQQIQSALPRQENQPDE